MCVTNRKSVSTPEWITRKPPETSCFDAFADWTDPERIVVNVYACYREFKGEVDRLPVPILFGSMARYHNERKARTSGRDAD